MYRFIGSSFEGKEYLDEKDINKLHYQTCDDEKCSGHHDAVSAVECVNEYLDDAKLVRTGSDEEYEEFYHDIPVRDTSIPTFDDDIYLESALYPWLDMDLGE